MTLNSAELRKLEESEALKLSQSLTRFPLYIILENVLDTYNIGGFFRLADAVAAEKIYLCGECAVPPDHKIVKASVGTYKIVPWEHKNSVAEAIKDLRAISDLQVIAVEQSESALDYRQVKYSFPLAFVFGHETRGISPESLKLVDSTIELPMHGLNKSLNVMVAAGIALYWAVEKSQKSSKGFWSNLRNIKFLG